MTPHSILADRAIFTSASSLTAQGYRIVAASPNLTSDEKREITRHAPSHEALCDKGEGATGMAFYSLPTGRVCVSHTCHSGNEESGRGGKRVLTNLFVIARDAFEHSGAKPFAVLTAAANVVDFTEIPPRGVTTLDALTLQIGAGRNNTSGSVAINNTQLTDVPNRVREFVIDRAMGDKCLLVANVSESPNLIESSLDALPAPWRAKCDFSIGLRFALSRKYRFVVITGDTGPTERVIKGQPITLLKAWDEDVVARHEPSIWARMTTDCRTRGCQSDLSSLLSLPFDNESLAAIDAIAQRQIAMNHLDEQSLMEWFSMLETATDSDPDTAADYCSVEMRLIDIQKTRAADRIANALENADESIQRQWLPSLEAHSGRLSRLQATWEAVKERLSANDADQTHQTHQTDQNADGVCAGAPAESSQ